MTFTLEFIRVIDQKRDIATLNELVRITKIGVEAVSYMYADHKADGNIPEQMRLSQENLVYRISAVLTQYELLVAGINDRSSFDLRLYPVSDDVFTHPIIYKYSCELGSMLDNVFFHLCSVFDYVGHFISYIFADNKDKTLDWDSLAKTSRAKYKNTYKTAEWIQEIDAKLRAKLDKHRSELIHRTADYRMVGAYRVPNTDVVRLHFSASPQTMRHFRNIVPDYHKDRNYTLDLLSSIVIYRSLYYINYLFDYIRIDLRRESEFAKNLRQYKRLFDHPFIMNPKNKMKIPVSENIWGFYKKEFTTFYEDVEKLRNSSMPRD